MNLAIAISRSKHKLIIILLLLTISSIQTKAQDYIPMLGDTNVWTYAHWPWEWVDIVTTKDSVYKGLTYKKILHEGWNNNLPYGTTGLLREDSLLQQVWYIEPDSLNERIIYDFSLDEGDSIWLQWNADAMGVMLQDGWYYVDSIRIKTFFETERRVFYLDNPLNEDIGFGPTGRPYIEWIEGVGSNLHPTYFVIKDCAADPCNIMFYYGASIICAFVNDNDIYRYCQFGWFWDGFWDGDCFTATDIENIIQTDVFIIYPNPVTNKIVIKTETISDKYDIMIRDIHGQILKYSEIKNKEKSIDVSDLSNGIYIISIYSKNNIITKKFIKL